LRERFSLKGRKKERKKKMGEVRKKGRTTRERVSYFVLKKEGRKGRRERKTYVVLWYLSFFFSALSRTDSQAGKTIGLTGTGEVIPANFSL
jgi:hypothetical protein